MAQKLIFPGVFATVVSPADQTVPKEDSYIHEFLAGVKAEIPILVGVIPFGMIYGVLAVAAGLNKLQAQSMSSIVFAGSSQFIATQLIAAGTPGVLMVFTIAVVNVRHMLYSASLAPYLEHLNTKWKMVLAYLLTDEAYAVTITYFRKNLNLPSRHWFLLGSGLALWTCWQLSTAMGIVLGNVIPDGLPLDFTITLTFIALLVPTLTDKPGVITALTSGLVALLFAHTPYKLGLVIAAVSGILVGMVVDRNK